VPVSQSNKVSVDDVQSTGEQTGHVFPQDPLGTDAVDDGGHFGPEPSVVGLFLPLPDDADGLAGEPSTDKVNVRPFLALPPFSGGVYVVVSGHVGPVLREDAPAPRVDLHLANGGHPGAFEAEFEAADA
jgi:hypothetical protein